MGALHTIAIRFSLYWILNWFDKVVHFLAGALVALAAYILFYQVIYREGNTRKNALLVILVVVIVVSVLWEIFEVMTGNTFVSHDKYVFDTTTDLIADLVGALSMYWFIKNKQNI